MIQRIQTLYLTLTAIILAAAAFIPFGLLLKSSGLEHVFISPMGTEPYHPVGYGVLLILCAMVSLANIFLWKNRRLQLRMTLFNTLLIGISYLVFFIYRMTLVETVSFFWYVPTTVTILAVIFNLMAIRGIRKDEQLIRSMDRIR